MNDQEAERGSSSLRQIDPASLGVEGLVAQLGAQG